MSRKIFNVIPGRESACILLYGNIGRGEKVEAADVVSELLTLQMQYRKIDVRINSYGGEVYEGIAICNALRNSTAEINIYVDGIAASMASVIALCGKPLHMSRFARLMIHQVSGTASGTAEEIRRAAQEAEAAQNALAGIIADRCKMPVEQVTERYFSGGEHWITADEALEMGLVDSIYDIEGQEPGLSATDDDIYRLTNRLGDRPQNYRNMAFIDDVRNATSLTNAATEQEMLQHITRLANEAAKVPALTSRIEVLEKEKSESLRAAHEALLNQAVSEGKIHEDQKETFMNLLSSDKANTVKLLESLPKKQSRVVDFIDGTGSGKGNGLASMSWDEIDRAERLAELKNKYPDLYRQKFEEKFGKK